MKSACCYSRLGRVGSEFVHSYGIRTLDICVSRTTGYGGPRRGNAWISNRG